MYKRIKYVVLLLVTFLCLFVVGCKNPKTIIEKLDTINPPIFVSNDFLVPKYLEKTNENLIKWESSNNDVLKIGATITKKNREYINIVVSQEDVDVEVILKANILNQNDNYFKTFTILVKGNNNYKLTAINEIKNSKIENIYFAKGKINEINDENLVICDGNDFINVFIKNNHYEIGDELIIKGKSYLINDEVCLGSSLDKVQLISFSAKTSLNKLFIEEVNDFKLNIDTYSSTFKLPKYIDTSKNYQINWSCENSDVEISDSLDSQYYICKINKDNLQNVSFNAEFIFETKKINKTFTYDKLNLQYNSIAKINYKVESIEKLKNQENESIKVIFKVPYLDNVVLLIRKYANEFEKIYPSVKIIIDNSYKSSDLVNQNIKDFKNQNAPTISIGTSSDLVKYLSNDMLVSLDKFIYNPNVGYSKNDLDDFNEPFIDEVRQFDEVGTFTAIPFLKSTDVMYYNKTFFDVFNLKVPTTWNELHDTSKEILNIVSCLDDYQYPFIGKIKSNLKNNDFIPCVYDSRGSLFTTLIKQMGSEYLSNKVLDNGFNDLNNGTIKYLDNDNLVKGLTYLQEMSNNGYFNIPQKLNVGYGSDKFTYSKIILNIASSTDLKYYRNTVFDIGVAPIPYFDEEHKCINQNGSNICMFTSATDLEKLAAWLFIKYLSTPLHTLEFAKENYTIPVRRSSFYLKEYYDFIKYDKEKSLSIKTTKKYFTDYWHFNIIANFKGSDTILNENIIAIENILCYNKDVLVELNEAIKRIKMKC